VLQWRPKPYRVDGVAKLQPSSLCLLSDIKSTNVSLSFIGRYLLVYCREYQTAHRSLVSTIAIFTVLRPRERWQSIVMSASVCLSVREHISRTARAIFAKFLRMLHMAVARSSSSGVAQSEGEGAILGFFPHWQCIIWAVWVVILLRRTDLASVLFFSRPRPEGWPHHGRICSIYLCPLSFRLTLPRRVLSTYRYWCCPSRPCM